MGTGRVMLKNISSKKPLQDSAYWSATIKERNEYVKAGKYSVIDCGFFSLYDTYVIGEQHKEAAEWLLNRFDNCVSSVKSATETMKESERKFDV